MLGGSAGKIIAGAEASGAPIVRIYPHGMAYEETAPIPLWDPRDNHP
jgi:hypothetical protein